MKKIVFISTPILLFVLLFFLLSQFFHINVINALIHYREAILSVFMVSGMLILIYLSFFKRE